MSTEYHDSPVNQTICMRQFDRPAWFQSKPRTNNRVLVAALNSASRECGIPVADLLRAVREIHAHESAMVRETEAAKRVARDRSGLNAGTIARIENNHRDHSTVDRFDETARDMASEYPVLGLPSIDPAPALWELLREGARRAPAVHSPEIIAQAIEACASDTINCEEIDNGIF